MLTETQARFVGAIAARVPLERIAEIHLFPPMKQGGVESGVAVVAAIAEPTDVRARITVYTARYKLALKGADRGKWEASVVAEAEAPLLTVDAVVRGVQQRAGETDTPERLTGEELRQQMGLGIADSERRSPVPGP